MCQVLVRKFLHGVKTQVIESPPQPLSKPHSLNIYCQPGNIYKEGLLCKLAAPMLRAAPAVDTKAILKVHAAHGTRVGHEDICKGTLLVHASIITWQCIAQHLLSCQICTQENQAISMLLPKGGPLKMLFYCTPAGVDLKDISYNLDNWTSGPDWQKKLLQRLLQRTLWSPPVSIPYAVSLVDRLYCDG